MMPLQSEAVYPNGNQLRMWDNTEQIVRLLFGAALIGQCLKELFRSNYIVTTTHDQ